VEFELVQDAQDAIDNLHHSELFGAVIKVSMARQTGVKVQVSNPNVAIWNDEAYLRSKAEFEATQGMNDYEAADAQEDEDDDAEEEREEVSEPIAKKSKTVPQPPAASKNPMTYFDISIGGTRAGRIVFLLRADVVPSKS
jgi:hypothetical protein